MRLVYQGVHADGVELTDLPGTYVKPGDIVDVPDDLGERYLEQPANWRKAPRNRSVDVRPNEDLPASADVDPDNDVSPAAPVADTEENS